MVANLLYLLDTSAVASHHSHVPPLFWYPAGIVLLDHHSHHCKKFIGMYVKKWTLILILALMFCRLFHSFSTNSLEFSARRLLMNFFTKSTNDAQGLYSKLFIEFTNSSSLMSFLIIWWNHFHDVLFTNGIGAFNWDVFVEVSFKL